MPPIVATLLAAVGTILIAHAALVALRARSESAGPLRPWRELARAFRWLVVGGGLFGIAMGLATGDRVLLWLSVAIAAEELWEATFLTGALRWAEESGWPDRIEMPRWKSLGTGQPG